MNRLDDNRWIYDSSDGGTSIREEARMFVADLLVGALVLCAMVGAITIGRLLFGAVTP